MAGCQNWRCTAAGPGWYEFAWAKSAIMRCGSLKRVILVVSKLIALERINLCHRHGRCWAPHYSRPTVAGRYLLGCPPWPAAPSAPG